MIHKFIYYSHLKELDKYLTGGDRFIDGEMYEIRKSGNIHIISGKFLVNKLIESGGNWRYRDVIREENIPLYKNGVKYFIENTKPLKFKKIQ